MNRMPAIRAAAAALLVASAAVAGGAAPGCAPSGSSGTGADRLPGSGLTIGLDNWFNNEWKAAKDGTTYPYHYLWDDTADSGFSQLAAIADALGYARVTLTGRPSPAALAGCDVVVIVDPDTPKETAAPNYMDEPAAAALEAWVRGGGVLLLLANDAGNCELERFNILAGRFGIRFNQDSRHRVAGKEYAAGATALFPDHPVFAGVRQIFTKEVCTMALSPPAVPLLAEADTVLIAAARAGRGLVVAVGDPWLYNEYMDNRRLPEGFDNALAARNLLSWFAAEAAAGERHRTKP